MVLEQIANLSLGVIRVLGSSPSHTAKHIAGIQGIGQSHKLGLVGSNPTSATNILL